MKNTDQIRITRVDVEALREGHGDGIPEDLSEPEFRDLFLGLLGIVASHCHVNGMEVIGSQIDGAAECIVLLMKADPEVQLLEFLEETVQGYNPQAVGAAP